MRRTLVVGAVLAVTLAVMWSCTVNTRSDKLACSTQADCGSSGRACENGYCVVDPNAKLDAAIDAKPIDAFVCPSACNGGCAGTTCMINGTGASVTCPTGFDCTISCATAGTCGTITCTDAKACDVTCSGSGACGDLSCGAGKCTETCAGSGACGTTSCAQSCDCNVTCDQSLAECGSNTCPTHGPHDCKTNGVCDAAQANACVQPCP